MASDDDSVLRNSYNNNEMAPQSSSSSATTSSTTGTSTAAPTMMGLSSGITVNSSSRYPGTGFTVGGECRSPRLANSDGHTTAETQPRREENPFSFKHFLNRESTSSLGSSSSSNNSNLQNSNTLMSNVAHISSNEQFKNSPNNNSNPINGEHIAGAVNGVDVVPDAIPTSTSTSALGSSTGAANSYQTSTGARPKVPQSIPTGGGGVGPQPPLSSSSVSASSISSMASDMTKMKRSPRFSSFDSQASLAEFASGTAPPAPVSSISGSNLKAADVIGHNNSDANPTANSMNNFFPNASEFIGQYVQRSFSNYDMDGGGPSSSVSPHRRISPPGPVNTNHMNLNAGRHLGGGRHQSGKLPPPIGPHGNRPVSEFSAALPDFVQDHWMDQWYCSLDMNINSPPNSPISPVDFVEDIQDIHNISNPEVICQSLPDFLSDGPIIHSSARLADVTAGLPGLDSPEDNSPSLQLSRLRLENERLRRELVESRLALADQTRRAGEMERRLEQARSNETAYSASLAQSMEQVEENLDQSKKRAAAAQSQVSKLKQQVRQLTAEVDVLRRENETLREEGAVGGDRATRRPSRTQQLSRDLRRAASTAENNLRQLLTGVENLRIMAATMESIESCDVNNPANPIVNDEYLSDSDVDFDDFSGPAL